MMMVEKTLINVMYCGYWFNVPFCALGWAAFLQLQLNGVNSSTATFCVGERITLTCTVASSIHLWYVPGHLNGYHLTRSSSSHNFGLFRFYVVQVDPDWVKTSIRMKVFDALNGSTITCVDGLVTTNPEIQTFTPTVLGKWLFCM